MKVNMENSRLPLRPTRGLTAENARPISTKLMDASASPNRCGCRRCRRVSRERRIQQRDGWQRHLQRRPAGLHRLAPGQDPGIVGAAVGSRPDPEEI